MERAGPIMTIEAVASWFGQAPVDTLRGRKQGASAALWQFGGESKREVGGEADPATHIVSLAAGGTPIQTYFGDGRVRHRKRAAPGLLNLVPAGERPRAVFEDCSTFRYLQVFMPQALLCELAHSQDCNTSPGELTLLDPGCVRDREIERIGNAIMVEMRCGLPMASIRFDALVLDLGVQLLRRHSNLSDRVGRRRSEGGLAPWQVKRACALMRDGLARDLDLATLATTAGCSPSHFSRAFKQSVGVPPFQWLLRQRIERAQTLIAAGKNSLAEVALEVGFAAQPQFTTAFRRVTGETPAMWRKRRACGG